MMQTRDGQLDSGATGNKAFERGSKPMVWTGRVLSGLAVLFLLMDAGMKLLKPAVVVEASAQMGYPESTLTGSGPIQIAVFIDRMGIGERR